MASVVINGPSVPVGTHNVILKDAAFHSPVARPISTNGNFAKIEVGISEGQYTTWIGTFTQESQKADAGVAYSILDVGRKGTRVRSGQIVVVRVTTTGTPQTLVGARVSFTLALVGNREGTPTPLIATGVLVADAASRTALASLERQVNTGGLAEWDESVSLFDILPPVTAGTFQARLQRDSATQLSLQRHGGNWVEVNGTALSIGSSGLTITTTDGLLSADGGVTSTALSAATLYYVYVGSLPDGAAQIRLSTTAPSRVDGVYALGSGDGAKRWRFVGWARTNGSTQFTDDTTDRLVVNYYHRVWKNIRLRPGYSDDSAATVVSTTSTTYVPINSGTGATASYIANGEDAIHVTVFARAENTGGNLTMIGIGDNSTTDASAVGVATATTSQSLGCTYSTTPATGYRTLVVLVAVTGGTGSYYIDAIRSGSSFDPHVTGLNAMVPV